MEAEALMRLAIEMARRGIEEGQSPFGCAIADGDRILAVNHNIVWRTTDITAHAEVTAIRAACLARGKVFLDGCVVATTCEPCPMCMSALHWARVKTVYFGATIEDAAAAGFNELRLSAEEVVRRGGSTVTLVSGILRHECTDLFARWQQAQGKGY